MTAEQQRLLEEIKAMQAEMNELEKELTEAQRRSLIKGMDDEYLEREA